MYSEQLNPAVSPSAQECGDGETQNVSHRGKNISEKQGRARSRSRQPGKKRKGRNKNGKEIKEGSGCEFVPRTNSKYICPKQGSPDPGAWWVVQPGSGGEPSGFR